MELSNIKLSTHDCRVNTCVHICNYVYAILHNITQTYKLGKYCWNTKTIIRPRPPIRLKLFINCFAIVPDLFIDGKHINIITLESIAGINHKCYKLKIFTNIHYNAPGFIDKTACMSDSSVLPCDPN